MNQLEADNHAYIQLTKHLLANKLGVRPIETQDQVERVRCENGRDSYDYYPCIEYKGYNHIKEIIKYAANELEEPIKFLDVGCGMGHILHYINRLYSVKSGIKRIDGLEREKVYHNVFKEELFPTYFGGLHRKVHYYNVDAFKFTKYYRYNLIYMYVPIRNQTKMEKLHEKIAKKAQKGTYIIDVGKCLSHVKETKLEKVNAPYTWRKI